MSHASGTKRYDISHDPGVREVEFQADGTSAASKASQSTLGSVLRPCRSRRRARKRCCKDRCCVLRVSCMSAKLLLRAARPLGRPVAAPVTARRSCALASRHFTASATRRAAPSGDHEPRTASTWSVSNVFAIAATAGLLGWGASEARHGSFPGTLLLDGSVDGPRYASMREMEQVCDGAATYTWLSPHSSGPPSNDGAASNNPCSKTRP